MKMFQLTKLALVWFFTGLISLPAAEIRKPNVVLLVADDMGFADCGVYGCQDIPTPNIDTLAKNGVRFRHGYTSGCVCSPTRAGLLTGRYQQRFGFDANAEGKAQPKDKGPRALDIQQVTFAQHMKSLGYATGIFGKWHQGAETGYQPTQRGFDEFYGLLPYGLAAGNPVPIYRGTNLVEIPKNHMETFCEEALSFIDRHAKTPFFLYLPFTAVHGPMVGPEPWLSKVDDRVPANRRKYAADLTQMDDIIGRVMAKLRHQGLEESSLVFFFSDNGGPGGAADNGVLRGTKWTLWDGGIHVPFIAQWKGRLPAGKVLDAPIMQIDLLPTAIAAAGSPIKPEWKLDGANLLPYMEGLTATPPHDALYWRFGIQYAVRQGDWKLVKPSLNDPPYLFNLSQDPGESKDLASLDPTRTQQLQALWDNWNKNNEEPRWIDQRWNSLDEMKKRAKGGNSKGKAKKTE